jgi:hypothetical protein
MHETHSRHMGMKEHICQGIAAASWNYGQKNRRLARLAVEKRFEFGFSSPDAQHILYILLTAALIGGC